MKLETETIYCIGPVGRFRTAYESKNSTITMGNLGECRGSKYYDNVPDCPNFGTLHGTELMVPGTIRDLYVMSRESGDLKWFPGATLVRKDRAEVLSDLKFSGFEFRPVNLYTNARCKERNESFVEMHITGRVQVDLARSGMRRLFECPICGAVKYSLWNLHFGLHFTGDFADWPDIFTMTPNRTSYRFLKGRFAQALIDLGLRPFSLTTLPDFSEAAGDVK